LITRQKATGARWSLPIEFISTLPTIDDIINIEGNLQKSSSISFSLKNKESKNLPFRAYFTKDSASDFTVSPAEGILKVESETEEHDNKFVVTFQPSSYGKSYNGLLIIEVKMEISKYRRMKPHGPSKFVVHQPNLEGNLFHKAYRNP
jgi:hypothetical protein